MNRIMKVFNKKTVLGIYFIILGLLAIFQLFFATFTVSMMLCAFLLVIGVNLIILAFLNKAKNGFLFIFGSDLVFAMIYLLCWFIFRFEIEKTWPLLPMFCGITFLLYYFLVNRKSFGLFISGTFITLLSIVLFFFSCGFFPKEEGLFEKVLFLFITLCFIAIGFFLLQAGQKERFIDDKEDVEDE
ncbi:MAG: hypothetical protein J6B11_08135 [Spirochaetales bacterium]|nr:hypothetical protein [Spirochaetales bacterium]